MLSILCNNFCRLAKRLPVVLIMTAVTLVSILLAVYITGQQQIKGRIAIVGGNSVSIDSKYLSVKTLKKAPPLSALMKQQYDAVVVVKKSGKIDIKTLRNAQFKNMIYTLLKNSHAATTVQNNDRGVGMNIFGFIMMFLLMGVSVNIFTFADDREQGQLARIATTPISFSSYLAAQVIYCFFVFLPPYLMLVVMKCIGFNIGFSLPQYALLFAALALLAIAFSLLLNTIFKKPDNASMSCNCINMLTTVFSGSFYSFSKDNHVFDNIIKVLPQKQLLNFAQHIQSGDALTHIAPLCYVLLFSLIMFCVALVKLRTQYVKKV